jgi:hypothetical protein
MRSWVFWACSLSPSDLPEAPWALKTTKDCWIGRTFVRGGPFLTVTNNEVWLRTLQRELREGPTGPRAKAGAVQEDLFDLARVLGRIE